jgi:hypothetical protein
LYIWINHANYDLYYPDAYCEITTSYQAIVTISIALQSSAVSSEAGLSFFAGGMNGQQFKATNTSPYSTLYNSPNIYDNTLSNIYYGRIYCASAFNAYAIGPWTQWGGTVNWGTAVNTSVWDTITAAATIDNTGSKASALRIHPGARLKIKAAKDLTCTGNTEINEPKGLWIESNSSGNGSFIDNGTVTYGTANTGSANVELYLTTCQGQTTPKTCWHYITPPLSEARAGVFNGDFMTSYDEPNTAWSDYYTHSGTLLNETQGYAVSAQGTSRVRNFQGQLNTGIIPTQNLTRTGSKAYGWNLIGNPYPSPIDLNHSGITWNSVIKKVYYLDQANGNYLVWNKTTSEYSTGTQYPLSMQGFFVYLDETSSSSTITFSNDARTTNTESGFYKNTVPDLLWLEADGNSGMKDKMIICFRSDATEGYDNELDCFKFYGDKAAPQLYSVTTGASKLTINSMPYAGINTVVPLGFSIESNGNGNQSITASNLESFRSGNTIILEDIKEMKTQELTINPVYTFTYTEGDDPARFLLHFFNPYFVEPGKENDMLIYSYGKDVYVKDLTGTPEKGVFYLYDMMGQEITDKPVSAISLNKYTFNLSNGYYVVRVITKDKTHNTKVYLD